MPKCPNCPKFTSKDTDTEPENDLTVDDTGIVTGTIRLVNNCEDCGGELEEYTFDVEADISQEIEAHLKEQAMLPPKKSKGMSHHLEVEADVSRTDEIVSKTRTGKPIKNSRYMKRLYGYEANITVTCACGASFTTTAIDSTQASSFDSLV